MKRTYRLRRITALVLAVLLTAGILASCGSDPSDGGTSGGGLREGDAELLANASTSYITQPLEIPASSIMGGKQAPDGSYHFIVYGEEGFDLYQTTDGESWEPVDSPLADFIRAGGETYSVNDFAYDSAGNSYVLYFSYAEDQQPRVGVLDGNGEVTVYPIAWKVVANGEILDAIFTFEDSEGFAGDETEGNATSSPPEGDDESSVGDEEDTVTSSPAEDDGEPAEDEGEKKSVTSGGTRNVDFNRFFSPQILEVSPEGDVLVSSSYSPVYRYGADGQLKEYYGKQVTAMAVRDNILTLFDMNMEEGMQVLQYDLDNGAELGRHSHSSEEMYRSSGSGKFAYGPGGQLYYAGDGIYKVNDDLSLEELVGSDELETSGAEIFFVPKEDVYICGGYDNAGMVLRRYEYAPDQVVPKDTVLRVYALEQNSAVEQAILNFQRTHPNVLIKLESFLDEDNTVTRSDAIRNLNTQLLADDGPDVILLDGLSVSNYGNKGVLKDLSDLLTNPDTDTDADELHAVVSRSFEEDGKVYAIPAYYKIPVLAGGADMISQASTLSDVADLAENSGGLPLFNMSRPEVLLRAFYPTTAPAWQNENGSIDQDAFAEMLELVKRISDAAPDRELTEDEQMIMEYLDTDTVAIYERLWFSRLIGVIDKEQHFLDIEMEGDFSVVAINSALKELSGKDELTGEDIGSMVRLMPGQTEGVYIPTTILGVNAKTYHDELATEFVQLALSYDQQKNGIGDGLPVNMKALEQIIPDDSDENYTSYGVSTAGGTYLEMNQPSSEIYEALLALTEQITTPVVIDSSILDIIQTEVQAFFDGTATAKEVAEAVDKKIDLYQAS